MWMRTIANWNVPRMARSKQRRIRSEIGSVQERKPRRLSIAKAVGIETKRLSTFIRHRFDETIVAIATVDCTNSFELGPHPFRFGGNRCPLTSLALWRCNLATFGFLYLIVSHCFVVLQGVLLSMYEAFLHERKLSRFLGQSFL